MHGQCTCAHLLKLCSFVTAHAPDAVPVVLLLLEMTSVCIYYFLRRVFDPSQAPSCSIMIVMMTFSAVIHLSNIFLLVFPLSIRAVFALVDI